MEGSLGKEPQRRIERRYPGWKPDALTLELLRRGTVLSPLGSSTLVTGEAFLKAATGLPYSALRWWTGWFFCGPMFGVLRGLRAHKCAPARGAVKNQSASGFHGAHSYLSAAGVRSTTAIRSLRSTRHLSHTFIFSER